MSKLRLDKYLADMGVGTRQEVKALIRKGRVVDLLDLRMPAQILDDLLRVLHVPLKPEGQGLHALQEEEGVERRDRRARFS